MSHVLLVVTPTLTPSAVRPIDLARLPVTSAADFTDAHVMALPSTPTRVAAFVDLIYTQVLRSLVSAGSPQFHAMADARVRRRRCQWPTFLLSEVFKPSARATHSTPAESRYMTA
jgi:hypothetical protein